MELRLNLTHAIDWNDLSRTGTRQAAVEMKKIAFDAYRKLMEKSPVDKGLFRGNWQLSIKAAASGVIQRMEPNKSGPGPITSELARLARYGADGTLPDIIIANNVPYAQRLEFGWSQRQAPFGIARPTIAEIVGSLS